MFPFWPINLVGVGVSLVFVVGACSTPETVERVKSAPVSSKPVMGNVDSMLARADGNGYSMKIVTPDPGREYIIRQVKPDPNVDYKLLISPPEAGAKRGSRAEESEKQIPRRGFPSEQ